MKCAILILVLVLLISNTHSNSCLSGCGALKIPFPFGVGKGCFLNQHYEVECRNSLPFLHMLNKEIVSIGFPRPFQDGDEFVASGSLRIKNRILLSVGCSGDHGVEIHEDLNFTGTPFYIGDNHTLVAFGCNNKATTKHIEPRLVGCISDIYNKIPSAELEKRCNGYQCCNVKIAEDVGEEFGVTIEGIDGGNTTTGGCRVAFLTDEFSQSSPWINITDPKWFYARHFSTIQLKWVVFSTNTSFGDSLRCGTYPLIDDLGSNPCLCHRSGSYLWCACTSGYEGNPYELDGCKDIDECRLVDKDGRPKYCINGETCQNIPGSYQCRIDKDKTFLIYIGVGIGLSFLLVGIGIWLVKVIKKQIKINKRKRCFSRNGGLLLQQQLTSIEGSVEKTIFSYKELEKATESFSLNRVLGQGGQGTVFQGMLADGTIVAVKKSKTVKEENIEQFINEIVILSQVNHRHIVQLVGCCLEAEVPLLVYEFIQNGNLYQLLHSNITTTWEARLRIAVDVAGVISYLHSSPVYHRDIKSTNIMLDDNYRAKVADFGTSRMIAVDRTHLTTVVKGTAGYIDPEYFQSGWLTEKSDVYSYAVVLAELITGERPTIPFQRFQKNMTLAAFFLTALEVIDPRIKDDCKLDQVRGVAEIARICLDVRGENRPQMSEVVTELERIGNEEKEEAVQVYRRSQSLNIDMASTSRSQYQHHRLVRSDTEPLFPRLSG